MKISIVTVAYNSQNTIRDTIESVLRQTYANIEYILVDGKSSDRTMEIVMEYSDRISCIVSEEDNGIYDAMNKGLMLASGDFVGILNSDDFFSSDNVISEMVDFLKKNECDAVYGDVHYVDSSNIKVVTRYYSSKWFRKWMMRLGFMPAHPSFYVKSELFKKIGYYSTDYKIAADFELLLRFIFVNSINAKYMSLDFVTMRVGGISNRSMKSHKVIFKEHKMAFKKNGVYSNTFLLLLRYFLKGCELCCFKVYKHLKLS